MYSIQDLPTTKSLTYMIWSILISDRKLVWDFHMPGVLVAVGIQFTTTCILFAGALIRNLPNDKILVGLPMSMIWGNTHVKWGNITQSDNLRITSDKQEWYWSRRLNPVPHHLAKIQATASLRHSVLTLACKPILVVTVTSVGTSFKSTINVILYVADFKYATLFNLVHDNFPHNNQKTSITESKNWWKNHVTMYNTLTSRAKALSVWQLSYWLWSCQNIHGSH